MFYRFCAPLSAIFLICAGFLTDQARAAPPVEAFGRLPAIDDVQLSPNGRHMAMLQSLRGEAVVTVYNLGGGAAKPLIINPTQGKVRRVMWANDERLLIWLSTTWRSKDSGPKQTWEVYRILSIKRDRSGPVFLFRGDEFTNVIDDGGEVISTLPGDPEHILMERLDPRTYGTGGKQAMSRLERKVTKGNSVYKVNVNTGHEDQVERNADNTRDWIADSSGMARVRVDIERDEKRIYARDRDGGRFRKVGEYDFDSNDMRSTIAVWGFANDPNLAYVTASNKSGRRAAYTFDLRSGNIAGEVLVHDTYDVGGIQLSPEQDRVVGVRYTAHMPRAVYIDKTYAGIQKKLEGALKGQTITIESASRDRSKIIFLARAPGVPGTYYLFDSGAGKVSPVGGRYPDLKPADLGAVKAISYKARDGLTIPAYLTLPPGKEAKNLPLVVLPHGGPEVRDTQAFDWWAQFYASRGYAVLQPNYRGSSGYGRKFVRAGYGEWGRKMQGDLTDGVKHLVSQGIADGDRVCIVGASYGGYAALAGATLTPDVYACAVSVAGVSDLPAMMGQEVKRSDTEDDSFSVRYWERWLGQRVGDADKMEAVSPVNHADAVQAPILLIHGKDDSSVRYLQSERMVAALRKAGKPHELITLEGEDHGLTFAKSRIRILKETEAFLAEHIGG